MLPQATGATKRASAAVCATALPLPQKRPKVIATDARPSGAGAATSHDGQGLHGLSDRILRAGFLRKVYGLLASQLFFTVAFASLCTLTPALRGMFLDLAQAQTWWLQLAFWLSSCASLVALKLGGKDKYPANYLLLFLFTLGISLQVGFVCSVFHSLGHGHLVLQAAGTTAVIFLGLTTYVLYSGKDFSYLGGFLMTALWGLVVTGFGGIFFPWLIDGLLYGLAGALIFCGLILYDTWRIQTQLGYDDYIGATITIYLDVVNLFLKILKILLNGKKKK